MSHVFMRVTKGVDSLPLTTVLSLWPRQVISVLFLMASCEYMILRVIVDLACAAIVGVPILLFKTIGQPYKRGFFCDDESLKHPYKDSTIPTIVLGIVGIGLTSICIFIGEAVKCKYPNCRLTSNGQRKFVSAKEGKFFHDFLKKTYAIVVPFWFGGLMTQLITDIAKYSLGRLRPHFFEACQPDFSKINCSQGYIEEVVCLNTESAYKLKDSRLSFMSGHASLGFYCMVFFALYIQVTLSGKPSRLFRPLLQLTVILMAYYTALSRISDYKHHWSDVLSGSLLGIVMALIMGFNVAPLFRDCKPSSSECQPLQATSYKSNGEATMPTPTQSSVLDMDQDHHK